MPIMGWLGKHGGGVEVPSAARLDKVSAYTGKQVRNLGDKSVGMVDKYYAENPFGKKEESSYKAEAREQIGNQRKAALEDVNERGMKGGYNSGLMEKLRKSTARTYDDADIGVNRDARLGFVERRTKFDMDLLDRSNEMAQFGSNQQLGNIWNRLAQKQNQAKSGMGFLKDVGGLIGGGFTGGMATG